MISTEIFPNFFKPMLATLTDARFDDKDWIYEKKLDGVRLLSFVNNRTINIYSRNKILQNKYYPELVKALKSLSKNNFILDGEVVSLEKNISSFSKLQGRMHKELEEGNKSPIKIYYYIFDLLYLNGVDLREETLENRKLLLKQFKFKDPLRLITYKKGKGIEYYKTACKKGWEGIIAKDFYSNYYSERTDRWLKFKCSREQEMVIGGFTKAKNSRIGFGALLLGYFENNKFIYAGKIGTGFNDKELLMLRKKMDKLKIFDNPFTRYDDSFSGVTWIKPQLVIQAEFSEWTPTGKLRHGRYIGLREDKAAKEVSREKALKL